MQTKCFETVQVGRALIKALQAVCKHILTSIISLCSNMFKQMGLSPGRPGGSRSKQNGCHCKLKNLHQTWCVKWCVTRKFSRKTEPVADSHFLSFCFCRRHRDHSDHRWQHFLWWIWYSGVLSSDPAEPRPAQNLLAAFQAKGLYLWRVQKCFFHEWTFACLHTEYILYDSFYTSLSCCFQRIFSTCQGRQQRLDVLGISFEFVWICPSLAVESASL